MPRIVLAEVLKRKRLSKREFAKRLGMQYHNVFRLFRPGQNPRFSTLVLWASVIPCKVRDLIRD